MTLRVDIFTLFPDMFRGPFDDSIIRRGSAAGLLAINIHDIRTFTTDRHHTADDNPFGGGAGLVLKAPPIFAAVESVLAETRAGRASKPTIILTAAQGRRFTQAVAEELAQRDHLLVICGHYEGIDERVREHLVTDEISIGDFVLTGGELAAMTMVDAVARLVPGVLGSPESLAEESIGSGLLEYPQYTRPADLAGWVVPDVLLSGDHAAIARWRRAQSLRRTYWERPDLLARAELTRSDADVLASQVALSTPGPSEAPLEK